MSYYNDGTVSVTNGNAHVLASGTVFVVQAAVGDLFVHGGYAGTIKSVISATELLLEEPWGGSTASNVAYQVVHVSDYWLSTVSVNEQLTKIIQTIEAGVGFRPNATGSLSERSNFDTAAKDFIFMRTDVEPNVMYVKNSADAGDWSSGASFQGPAGPQGIQGASGSVGPANTLSVGTVLAGDTPAATITGTAPTQVLNLTLPQGAAGTDGSDGIDGWTPVFAIVTDSARRVLQVADWTGGAGSKPATGQYAGATGLTSTLASGIDIRGTVGATGPANTLTAGTVTTGAAGSSASVTVSGTAPDQTVAFTIPRGDTGAAGTDGIDGWTPVFAIVNDSARRVLQVADWTGGEGSKPATGQYVGATGLTSTLADGVDIRGPSGAAGPANVLSVGTVTTGAAGSSVAVTITGTAPTQSLNLTIPKGDQGEAGTPIEVRGNNTDAQLEWRLVGDTVWTPLVTYAAIQAASLHDYAPDIAVAKASAIGVAFLF